MQLRSIKIENFRCYKSFEMDFQKCHALIGANGAGKTSILDAVNLVTSQGYAASRITEEDFNIEDQGKIVIEIELDPPFITKIPDGYTTQNIPCSKLRLEAKRREKAAPGKALSEAFVVEHYAIPVIYGRGNKPNIDGVPEEVTKTQEGFRAPRKNGKMFDFSKRSLSVSNESVGYPNVFYFDRGREKETKSGYNTLFQRILKDLNWRYRKNWEQADALVRWEEYYRTTVDKVIDPKSDKILKPLVEQLNALTGDNYENLEISLLDIEQPFAKGFLALRHQTNQIAAHSLGSGVSILLSFLLLETMAKRSKEEIIVLIDEPELHLHPQLQGKLNKYFRDAKYQILFTTQSESLVDISDWRSVTRVSKAEKYPKADKILEKMGDGRSFADHLDDIKKYNHHRTVFYREDSQLFFASKCLLVEGPNDKYGLPILANLLGKDFDDITIISCGGKGKIKHYKTLCLAYDIPSFVVYDGDGGAENDEKENALLASLEVGKSFCFGTSFEKVLNEQCGVVKRSFLRGLDELQASNLPPELVSCLQKIDEWSDGCI